MNIPNYLTVFRIALIPFFVLVFYCPFEWHHEIATLIFISACLTDYLDGYFARSLQQISTLGTFLDPVADKLVVVTALVLLLGQQHAMSITLPVAVIIGREIVVSSLREWMAELGKRASVAVSWMGRVKTATQMLSIVMLLLAPVLHAAWMWVAYILLYGAAFLTLWSMMMYLKLAWPDLLEKAREGP